MDDKCLPMSACKRILDTAVNKIDLYDQSDKKAIIDIVEKLLKINIPPRSYTKAFPTLPIPGMDR